MKVLLISPVAGLNEAGGDRTYTHILEQSPPRGVEYETYDSALRRGTLRERGTGRALKATVREAKSLALREAISRLAGETALTTSAKTLNTLREKRWLFWEPYLFYEAKTGEYDLIHTHIFSARFDNLDCPLVVSCGGPLRHLYLDARHYPPTRVKRLERIDHLVARMMGVNATSEWLPQASQLYTFTKSGSDEFKQQRLLPRENINYIPFYLPTPPEVKIAAPSKPFRVGFVARNFNDKGGPVLLRAWDQVRKSRPDAHLQIVGMSPPPESQMSVLRSKNIEWSAFIPREQLLEQIMPNFDVFAYPTHYDYLPCYTLLEVMARGVPIAGSDHRDMDVTLGVSEKGGDGVAGLMAPVGDAAALVANILRLLEPQTNARFRRGARQHFEAKFSQEAVLPLLSESYQRAQS